MIYLLSLLIICSLLGFGAFHAFRPYLLLAYPLNRKAFRSLKKRSWTLQAGSWQSKINEEEWIEVTRLGVFHRSKNKGDVQLLPSSLAKHLELQIVQLKKKEQSVQRRLTIESLDQPTPNEGWLSDAETRSHE